MLVLGDEVISMTKYFIRGVDVSEETLARDVIEKVGPGGHFLDQDHTFKHFRKELWMPRLLTRQPYDIWSQRGSKDMSQRVAERVREILETHPVPPLPDKTLAALEKLRIKGEKELIDSISG
jgi:trimethylamine--corrinoid protein Co-methyltransferase